MCYLNEDHCLPPLSLGSADTPDPTAASRNIGLPLPSAQLEGFPPRRNRTSALLTLSLATVAEAKFWVSAVEKWTGTSC